MEINTLNKKMCLTVSLSSQNKKTKNTKKYKKYKNTKKLNITQKMNKKMGNPKLSHDKKPIKSQKNIKIKLQKN